MILAKWLSGKYYDMYLQCLILHYSRLYYKFDKFKQNLEISSIVKQTRFAVNTQTWGRVFSAGLGQTVKKGNSAFQYVDIKAYVGCNF